MILTSLNVFLHYANCIKISICFHVFTKENVRGRVYASFSKSYISVNSCSCYKLHIVYHISKHIAIIKIFNVSKHKE